MLKGCDFEGIPEIVKDQLPEVVRESLERLSGEVRRHQALISGLLDIGVDPNALKKLVGGDSFPCREKRFRRALEEAVEVLEESRSSFKSKRLEALRKKLMQVLLAD